MDSFDMPVKNLTGITFGGTNNKGLLVTSAGKGRLYIVTGTGSKGVPDETVRW